MKKLLAALAVVVLLGAAGAGWYVFVRPHDRLALARSLMGKGDARAAQLALRSALLADPTNAEAHFRLGEVQLRLGEPVAAQTELTEARQRGWDEKAVRAPLAEAVLAQGHDAEVLASFSPDGLPPDKAATVLVARSDAALRLHQARVAVDAAAQAERLAPHDAGAALASAQAAAASGDRKAADQAIGRALAIDPHSVTALSMQAAERRAAGDTAGALQSLDAAVAAAPDSAQPRFDRAQLLLQMGRDAAARADVGTVLKQDPRSPLANYMQAELLVRAHDFAAADTALEMVGPALDQLPRGEMLRAIVKANVKQPEQAAEAAAHYLGRAPGDPAAYKLSGTLALQAHRPADAADVLNRAVLGGHADAVTYDLLGQAEAQLGHADAALAAMQQAAVLAPKDQAILARLAALQLGRGDASNAAGDLQRLLDLEPASPAAPKATPVAASGPSPGSSPTPAPAPAPPPAAAAAAALPSPTQTAAALVLASLQAGETDRAAAALERLRKLGAGPVQLDILTGLLKAAQLDLPAAQQSLQAAIDQPAATPAQLSAARTNLAGVLGLQGKRDQAEALLRKVLAGDPANVPALSALQRLLRGAGRTADSIAAMEAAHAAAPANPTMTVALADLYDRAGQPERALALLAAPAPPAATAGGTPVGTPGNAGSAPSAAAGQTEAMLLAAKAQAQLAAGKRADAEASLRQLLATRPTDVTLRRELAGLLLVDHDSAGAQSLVDEGLAGQPGSPALLAMSLDVALQTGGIAAAIDRAEILARDPANAASAPLLKGGAYMAAKQYAQAAAAFAAELHAGNASPVVAQSAAAAAQAAGHPDQAAGLLRDYLGTHPDATDVASALAVLEIGAKRLESARGLLQQVLAHQPNNPAALNNLAWVEAQLHHGDQARALAQRSWLLSATPQAADTLGWILVGGEQGPPEPGQGATALDLLRQAATSLPADPSVQYHYAVALQANGQDHAAAAILAKLTTQPAFDEQAQARKRLDSLPHT